MAKLHNLYYKVEIEKETEKAVYIKAREIDFKDLEEINELVNVVGHQPCFKTKGTGFWLPKSQIEIADNKVTKITKWLLNTFDNYYDSPLILEEEVAELKKYDKRSKQNG